jgi:hypothetical protein
MAVDRDELDLVPCLVLEPSHGSLPMKLKQRARGPRCHAGFNRLSVCESRPVHHLLAPIPLPWPVL